MNATNHFSATSDVTETGVIAERDLRDLRDLNAVESADDRDPLISVPEDRVAKPSPILTRLAVTTVPANVRTATQAAAEMTAIGTEVTVADAMLMKDPAVTCSMSALDVAAATETARIVTVETEATEENARDLLALPGGRNLHPI